MLAKSRPLSMQSVGELWFTVLLPILPIAAAAWLWTHMGVFPDRRFVGIILKVGFVAVLVIPWLAFAVGSARELRRRRAAGRVR